MGWASASDIFNVVGIEVCKAVGDRQLSERAAKDILRPLARHLMDGDWDTVDKSMDVFRDDLYVREALQEAGAARGRTFDDAEE